MSVAETMSLPIPLQWVGPIKIGGAVVEDRVSVPLATYETPLWPSVKRGARVSDRTERGVVTTLVDERMTRSVIFATDGAAEAAAAGAALRDGLAALDAVVTEVSRFAHLVGLHYEVVGYLLYVRFEFTTGDASGHNMVTLCADRLMRHITETHPGLRYGSISGNLCADKKATAVNGILGRGKNVVAELLVPEQTVRRFLHTSAARIAELNVRKNLIGTTLAGGLRSANAHYANMLLAFYLATGQDGANIVEGSQGITHAEDRDGDLYFTCALPNLIVGTVGNGKDLPAVAENLRRLGCTGEGEPGADARRLAAICAATVLCGELSLLAAQTNEGELMSAHVRLERKTAL